MRLRIRGPGYPFSQHREHWLQLLFLDLTGVERERVCVRPFWHRELNTRLASSKEVDKTIGREDDLPLRHPRMGRSHRRFDVSTPRKKRRVLCNDDGWILEMQEPPITVAAIREKMVRTYERTPVDGLLWCIGDHEVYNFETQVGEQIGSGSQDLRHESEKYAYGNLHHLIGESGGPMTAMVKVCKEAGMDLFPSVRMNSHYHIEEKQASYGRHRRENPHLRIGPPDEDIPIPSVENAIRTGLDYKFYKNRRIMANVICELFERWDVAGVELDFMRHPAMFRPEEAYAHRYLMTDFVRFIRSRMDEIGHTRGKHLELITRVAPTVADSVRTGLDVETWIKDKLVDIVVVGVGFLPFEMKLREFVDLTEGTDCQIYGSVEALRWALDEDVLAAIAQRYYKQGAVGIHLFNFFNLPQEWKQKVLGGIADPNKLARLDKQYELDRSDRVESTSWHVGAFRYTIPRVQLPAQLRSTETGQGMTLVIEIADDMDQTKSRVGAANIAGPTGCTLGLGFEFLPEGEILEVRLNSTPLDWNAAHISVEGWNHSEFTTKDGNYHTDLATVNTPGTLVEFDVDCLLLREGANVVELRRAPPHSDPVTLLHVTVKIQFN